jgi:2-polyprenyl-3-methyl-5-hydroxy-6-metoxy-1,4-benzoquinol methylase
MPVQSQSDVDRATDWRIREWEEFGRLDPYYGVLAQPQFHSASIDESSRAAFFEDGEREVRATLATMRQLVGGDLRIRRALDFGCGVGRLTIPLARSCATVVGVDASPAMLDEARRNCLRAGVSNVEFAASRPRLAGIAGPFDFVHSYIVFQHIPTAIGYELVDAMLARLAPDGGGMLHFTYARNATLLRRAIHRARRSSRLAHRFMNLLQGRSFAAPLMAMFEYDIGRILAMLHANRRERIAARLTDHGGHLGVMLFFARDAAP